MTHVKLISPSMLKSIIITFQGAQVVYQLISNFLGTGNDEGKNENSTSLTLAIDSVFGSLALMGLLRLSAAYWLTDDFIFSFRDSARDERLPRTFYAEPSGSTSTTKFRKSWPPSGRRNTTLGNLPVPLHLHSPQSLRRNLRPISPWPDFVFRLFYLGVLVLLWVADMVFLIPPPNATNNYFTNTLLMSNLCYLVLLISTIIIFAFYFFFKKSTSTVIPCASSIWYKFYTAVLTLMASILVVIATVETRKTPCGKTTSWPPSQAGADLILCPDLRYMNSTSKVNAFGVATFGQVVQNGTAVLQAGQVRLVEFTGFYQGIMGAAIAASMENYTLHPS